MKPKNTPNFRTDSVGNVIVKESILGPAAVESNIAYLTLENPPELQARYQAGNQRYRAKDFEGALVEYRSAADLAEAIYGRNHAITGHYLALVGIVLKVLRRDPEALATHLEVLRIRDAALPANSPEIASSCNNVAVALEELGRHSEAQQYYSRAIQIETATFGRNGDPTLTTRVNQVGSLYAAHRFQEAAELITGIVDDVARRRAAGEMNNRPLESKCLKMLVGVYRAAGRRTFRGKHEPLLREYGLA